MKILNWVLGLSFLVSISSNQFPHNWPPAGWAPGARLPGLALQKSRTAIPGRNGRCYLSGHRISYALGMCPRIVEAFKVCGPSPTQSHIFWRYEDEEGNHRNQEFESVPSVNYIIGFPTPNFFIQEAGAQVFAIPHQEVLLIITGGCLESCQANMGR